MTYSQNITKLEKQLKTIVKCINLIFLTTNLSHFKLFKNEIYIRFIDILFNSSYRTKI
jgi:hypothetical protein